MLGYILELGFARLYLLIQLYGSFDFRDEVKSSTNLKKYGSKISAVRDGKGMNRPSLKELVVDFFSS